MADLEGIFEACVAQLNSGAPADACLTTFPQQAAELAPLLPVVAGLQALGEPVPAMQPGATSAARARFLARARALSQPPVVPIEDALEASVRMIARGAEVEDCLESYPHYARELRSALAMAGAMQARLAAPAPLRPAHTWSTERQRFVASAQAARRAARGAGAGATWWARWAGALREPALVRIGVVLAVVLLVLGFGRVAVSVASDTLPGDTFYPVKLLAEQVRLLAAPGQGQRASLQQQFEQNRRQEAAAVVEQRRQVYVQFPGVIDSMVDGQWQIDGLGQPLLVPGDAVVIGQPAVGRLVLVLAYSDGSGSLVARQVIVSAAADAASPTPTVTPSRTPRLAAPADAPSGSQLPAPVRTARPLPMPTGSPTGAGAGLATPIGSATLAVTPSGTPSASPSVAGTATLLPRPVTLVGVIQERNAAWWLVDGQRVLLTAGTSIDEAAGPAVVGAEVRVDAVELPDQGVVALRIRVLRPSGGADIDVFTGVIRAMGGSQWLIGSRWVVVTGSTQIIGAPAVGRTARVSAQRVGGGPWTAARIEVEELPEPEPFTPAPAGTPMATAPPTPEPPTMTPPPTPESPTATAPVPTATSTPTFFFPGTPPATPVPTPTPTATFFVPWPPTATPAPTATPTRFVPTIPWPPTATPAPTATPTPPFPFPTPPFP